MTAAALLTRETAIADVKRRPREPHQYGDTLPDALILRLDVSRPTLDKITDRMLYELTVFDRPAGGRAIPATAGTAGLADLLVMIMQGWHRVSLTEAAAIMGVHVGTAQRRMSDLRDAGILRAPEIGRKGQSVTRYEVGPLGARMLADAHAWLTDKRAQWDEWRAKRKARKGSVRKPQLTHDQHSKMRHRESPLSSRTGPTEDRHRPGDRAAPRINAATGPGCPDDPLTPASRCAYCRHGRPHP